MLMSPGERALERVGLALFGSGILVFVVALVVFGEGIVPAFFHPLVPVGGSVIGGLMIGLPSLTLR